MSGSIPVEFGDLTNLTRLALSSNGLSGGIPVELGALTNLTWLNLGVNRLSGGIPVELGDLTNLTRLALYSNGLSGGIPVELGDLTNLRSLDLSTNGLSGGIPVELGDLTNLTLLGLSRNGLSGGIPVELGDLTNLTTLGLSSNGLSGGIPVELGDLTNLTWLSLHSNGLSGGIPVELGDLTNLTWLYLGGNMLSGCVPAALSTVADIGFDRELSYCGTLELVGAVLVGGSAVELVYGADLDGSSVPAVGAFTVSVDGASRTVSGVTVAGRVVTLTLASPPVLATQDVTVSYTPPTATDAGRIQITDGDAAASFADEAVTIPPDPPAITSVESATGGLEAQWDAVADITGYDLEWRHDGETSWRSTRTDQQQHTISDLTDGALYWVRLRAVKTHQSLDGQTLYTTAWSAPEPGIAGDWAPRNVVVTPGDRMLTVTWDGVDAADDYEAQWQPESTASSGAPSGGGGLSESPSRQRRPDSATSRNVLPPLPELGPDAWLSVPFELVSSSGPLASAWSATVTNLGNGEDYSVRVRSLRSVDVGAGDSTQQSRVRASGWVEAKSAPAVSLAVSEPTYLDGGSFVRSGNTAKIRVQVSVGGAGDSPPAVPLRAQFVSGPSDEKSVAIECIAVSGSGTVPAFERHLDVCTPNEVDALTLTYTVGAVAPSVEGWSDDTIRLYVDQNPNGAHDDREAHADFTVRIAEPIDYVALGDSYSAGENGEYYSSGGFGPGTAGQFYFTNGASADCHRWNKAYPILVASSDLNIVQRGGFPGLPTGGPSPIDFYACVGAIARNIYHSDDTNNDGVPDDIGIGSELSLEQFGEVYDQEPELMTIATNRPSSIDSLVPYDFEADQQDAGWVPRQAVSLRAANAARAVDMVTVSIGGNDLGFADRLTGCLSSELALIFLRDGLVGSFAGALPCVRDDGFESGLGDFMSRLGDVLGELQEATPADAVIFVLGYSHLVPPDDRYCDALTLLPALRAWNAKEERPWKFAKAFLEDDSLTKESIIGDERMFVRDAAVVLNDVIANQVKSANRKAAEKENGDVPRIHFVDVREMFEGHYACGDRVVERHEDAQGGSGTAGVDGLWLNGLVGDSRIDAFPPKSDRSFHPTAAGHQAYAAALGEYIRDRIRGGATVTDAGLPLAEVVPLPSRPGESSGQDGSGRDVSARSQTSPGAAPEGGTGDDPDTADDRVWRQVLWSRPADGAASGCSMLWSPGERVELAADGFAAGAAVTLSAVGGTLSRRDGSAAGASLGQIVLPSATADSEGRLVAVWTVPAATDASTPVWYAVTAEGDAAPGGRVVAGLLEPLVVYPGTQPCPAHDAATTTLGTPVRVDVLADDVAPTGGAFDPASVTVEAAGGGEFTLDPADGSVTFTPDPGFVGTATTTYTAYDSWNVGIRTEVSVTVEAGCTITGAIPDGSGAVIEVTGTGGDDVICVGDPSDRRARYRIDAKAGDDVILAGAGPDVVLGGPGADVIYGRGGDDQLVGGSGVDVIYGGGGFDSVYSSDLADVIVDAEDGYELVLLPVLLPASADGATAPVAGADAVFAEPGAIVLVDVLGNDFDADGNLDGPSLAVTRSPVLGSALVFVSVEAGLVVRYVAGSVGGADGFAYEICDTLGNCVTAEVTVTVGTAGCTIVGTDGDDVLEGTPGDDVICGLGGDDTIVGLGGDDVIWGGAGNDTLYGGDETRIGDDGNDVLHGEGGDDALYGGNGADILWGGPGDDSLAGNRRDDVLHGGAGDDTLVGGGEDDVLWGGRGDDSLDGHAGDDVLHGGAGGDTLEGGNGEDTLWGGGGVDTLVGGAGSDILHGGGGDDTLWGNSQDDALLGGRGADALHGGGGGDELDGGPGDDALNGNAGDDRLWGSWGVDVLVGGNGEDFLHGGDGADTCGRGPLVVRCEP